MYDICVIDYFTEEFMSENQKNCMWRGSDIKPIMARGHGQAILEIICQMNSNVKWCYASVGRDTTLDEIMDILCYLEEYHIAKVINMSFGFYSIERENEQKYQRIIDRLLKKKIKVVSATDEGGKRTFPASFKGVYSVYINQETDVSNIVIGKDIHEIYFPLISLYVPWILNTHMWVWGTSFYTAIISGLFTMDEKNDELLYDLDISDSIGAISIRYGTDKNHCLKER